MDNESQSALTNVDEESQELQKCIQGAQESVSRIESKKQMVSDQYEQFSLHVETSVNEIIEYVHSSKQQILDIGNNIKARDTKRLEELNKATREFIAKLSQQNDQLQSKKDQFDIPDLTSLKTDLTKCQQHVDCLKKDTPVTGYAFGRSTPFDKILTDGIAIGAVQLSQGTAEGTLAAKTAGPSHQARNSTSDSESEFEQHAARRDRADSDDGAMLKTKKRRKEKEKRTGDKKMESPKLCTPILIQRILFCENIDIDNQILRCTARKNKKEIGVYVDNRKLRVRHYYEIEILALAERSKIALGVLPEECADEGLMPGLGHGTRGYHSNGKFHISSERGEKVGDPWRVGDRIGCQINYSSQNGSDVVFTRNGEVVTHISRYVEEYFVIGMTSIGDKVKVLT